MATQKSSQALLCATKSTLLLSCGRFGLWLRNGMAMIGLVKCYSTEMSQLHELRWKAVRPQAIGL